MKKSIGLMVAAFALGIGIPIGVMAAIGAGASSLDKQAVVWRDSSISTSSKAWSNVPNMSVTVCAINAVTVDVTAGHNNSPLSLRVLYDEGGTLTPGAIRTVAPNGAEADSFTFTINAAPFEANDNHSFTLQWRQADGNMTTLTKALMNVQYEQGTNC